MTAITYGQILPEYLCRRMRAMVVRTAIVVHMVLVPRDPGAFGSGWLVHSNKTFPIERL